MKSKGCFIEVSRMFHAFMNRKFQGCFKKFQECFKSVPRVSQERIKGVSRVFIGYFKSVSRVFQQCF